MARPSKRIAGNVLTEPSRVRKHRSAQTPSPNTQPAATSASIAGPSNSQALTMSQASPFMAKDASTIASPGLQSISGSASRPIMSDDRPSQLSATYQGHLADPIKLQAYIARRWWKPKVVPGQPETDWNIIKQEWRPRLFDAIADFRSFKKGDSALMKNRFDDEDVEWGVEMILIALEKLETKGCMLHPFIDPTVTPKYAETGAHVGAILLEKSKIDQKARDMGPLQRLPIFEKALREDKKLCERLMMATDPMVVLKLLGASPEKSCKQRELTWIGNNKPLGQTTNAVATSSTDISAPGSNVVVAGYGLDTPSANYQDNRPPLPPMNAAFPYGDTIQDTFTLNQGYTHNPSAGLTMQMNGHLDIFLQDDAMLGDYITSSTELHYVMQYETDHDGQLPVGYLVRSDGTYCKLANTVYTPRANTAMVEENHVPEPDEFELDFFFGEQAIDGLEHEN